MSDSLYNRYRGWTRRVKGRKDNVSEERVQRELARFAEPKKRLVEDRILTMKSLILAQDER